MHCALCMQDQGRYRYLCWTWIISLPILPVLLFKIRKRCFLLAHRERLGGERWKKKVKVEWPWILNQGFCRLRMIFQQFNISPFLFPTNSKRSAYIRFEWVYECFCRLEIIFLLFSIFFPVAQHFSHPHSHRHRHRHWHPHRWIFSTKFYMYFDYFI